MSDELLDDFLKKIRETGETSLVPGFLDRGITSQNPGLSINTNIEDVATASKEGRGAGSPLGMPREIGGKIYLNKERTEFLPYNKDALGEITTPTAMNVAGNVAPYYGAVAGAALVTGGLGGALGTYGAGAASVAGVGAHALHIAGFLGGSVAGGYGAVKGLGAAGFEGPTEMEMLTQPGAIGLTETGIGLATFRPGLPAGGITKAHLRGAGLFAGMAGGADLTASGISALSGNEERSVGKVLADAALHTGEAFAFGTLMKPTALGSSLIGAGARMANAGNVIPSMIASNQFGVGNIPAGRLPKGYTYDQNNTRGRGGILRDANGVPIAVDPSELNPTSDVANPAGGPRAPKPSATGFGDGTSFDPATGAGTRVTVLPNGDRQVTIFTNLGGSALKAKGPYKNSPDVIQIDSAYDLIRVRFDEKMAERERAAKAERDRAEANTVGDPARGAPRAEPIRAEDLPPAEAVSGATERQAPPESAQPKPEPVKPAEPVSPAKAVAEGTKPVSPVSSVSEPAQAQKSQAELEYERSQDNERLAGNNQRLAAAQLAAAEAAEKIDSNSVTRAALADARRKDTEALVSLERAQKRSEEAIVERDLRKQDVEPRPRYGEKGYSEWGKKYGITHEENGRKRSKKVEQEFREYDAIWESINEWEKKNNISTENPEYSDTALSVGRRRIIPLNEVPAELHAAWRKLYSTKYNDDGYAKKYPKTEPVEEIKPPVEAVEPPKEEPSTEIAQTQATREQLLDGSRPMKDAPAHVIQGLTPEERRQVIQKRKEFLAQPKPDAPTTEEKQTAVVAETGETVVVPKSTVPKELPMPEDPALVDEYNKAIIDPNLAGVADSNGKEIAVSSLSIASAESLYKRELKKISISFGTDKDGKYLFKPNYPIHVANARKLKAHIDKLKSQQPVAEPAQPPVVTPKPEGGDKRTLSFKTGASAAEVQAKVISTLKEFAEQVKERKPLESDDPGRYVIEIPKRTPFGRESQSIVISVKQDAAAIEGLIKSIESKGASAWSGVSPAIPGERKSRPRSMPQSQLRGPRFSEKLTKADKKELQELLESETKLLSEDNEFLIRRGISRSELEESIKNIQAAIDKMPETPGDGTPSVVPDPQGRKNVMVQTAVVGERDKDTDRLQVVGVDAPAEIHKNGMRNPEPLELEAPGGPSTESWPAYQLALEREGAKNVYIIRLPGTKEGGKSYNMAITGLITIKFKKGQGGNVIPVLNSVGMDDVSKSTRHWLNWKIVEFYPEVVDNRGSNWFLSDPRYSYNLAESGGKEFGEIQNSTAAKKEFIERLFATLEVRVPGDFKRDESTYGFDNKPTLYFNQSAMIEAELQKAKEIEAQKVEKEGTREMSAAEHWDVEKGREEAAQKVRTPRATEATELSKTKAQIDAEGKVEGAKKYGASGVRFNIGGPKNPDSFGGEIRGEKGVKVETSASVWSPNDLQLIKDYLSPDAAVLRNMGYPKFFFNSQISGEDSNWVSAPVPAANGNFLIYEVNPKGSGAVGSSYVRKARLFRRLVNSEGKQIGSMTEVAPGQLAGMSTITTAADGKPTFQVPAIFHAMMKAAQDSLAAREMTEDSVNYSGDVTNPNPLNARIPLSGTVHEDLVALTDAGLANDALRQRMEVFNSYKNGSSINTAIIGFISSPEESSRNLLLSELEGNALMARSDAEVFISEVAAQMGLSEGDYTLVGTPNDDEMYPIMKRHSIYPTEAALMLKWINNGYQRIIYEVGQHDPDTGLELPDKVPVMLKGQIRYLPKPGPNGEKMPLMVNNPDKWRAQRAEWMKAEDFTITDKDGKITFQPKPHQVVGPNAAMSRWFPAGVNVTPRPSMSGVLPRAILINDAPGTGKTLQMLMTAVLYRAHLLKLTKDANSPWYGKKIQPVLIITQNAQIVKNAFQNDARMAQIDLKGTFTDEGFEPNEYEDTPNGRILTGDSWIDIGTYSSLKPTMEVKPVFEKDGKTPKMVRAVQIDEAGNVIEGPDGKPLPAFHPTELDGEGNPAPLMIQQTKEMPVGPSKKGNGEWGVVMFDESHNMKNEGSARSDAGFDVMMRSQHALLASGTPIDKPTQLGPLLAMLIDKPLSKIAEQLGMKVGEVKRNEEVLAEKEKATGVDQVLEKQVLQFGTIPDNAQAREQYVENLFIKLRALRDEAGKSGAILRRSTKYFGHENIWLDPTESMHEDGKKALIKLQKWWYEEMASGAEGGGSTGLNARNMKGMLLFESKRLTSLIKCGIPGTPWNPGENPLGAAKIMLDELAEGRKVIITMDTSNLYNLKDSEEIRKFRGLQTETGNRLPYESEAVLWGRYLDKLGIKYGSITGNFNIAQREQTISEFQKNNPELQVIIMTTMSGGTGLSIDDRHGIGGKTNPQKTYTDEEVARMKLIASESIEGEKVDTKSMPRTMIIVSAPWGGDVFIQAMGRTDRVLSTSPSRIIVLTSTLSEGDQKLANLVKMKTTATNAINENKDELEMAVREEAAQAAIAGGAVDEEIGVEMADGQLRKISKEEIEYKKEKARNVLRMNRSLANLVARDNKKKIAEAEKNKSTQRDLTRWEKTVEVAEEYVKYINEIISNIENNKADAVELSKRLGSLTFQAYKENKRSASAVDVTEVETTEEDGDSDYTPSLPITPSLLTRTDNPVNTGELERKGKPSKNRQLIERIYGVNHQVSGGKVTMEELNEIERVTVQIIKPSLEMAEAGNMNDEQLLGILRIASDVSFLIKKYDFVFDTDAKNLKFGGFHNAAKRLIRIAFAPVATDRTIYHEIGHALFDMLPEQQRNELVNEFYSARKSWVSSMEEGHGLRWVKLPQSMKQPYGISNLNAFPTEVEKSLGPGLKKVKFTDTRLQFSANSKPGMRNTHVNHSGRLAGMAMLSKAMYIARSSLLQEGLTMGPPTKFAREESVLIGGADQLDIILEAGLRPAENAARALTAALSLATINLEALEKAKINSRDIVVGLKGIAANEHLGTAASKISLVRIIKGISKGNGFLKAEKGGTITLVTRGTFATVMSQTKIGIRENWNIQGEIGAGEGNIIEIKMSAKALYEALEDVFGSLESTKETGAAARLFHSELARHDFNGMHTDLNSLINSPSKREFKKNYKYANSDEWLANNAEELFNDYYGQKQFNNETGITAAITSVLFTHASANGLGNVAKSIIAGLVAGDIKPKDATPDNQPNLNSLEWEATRQMQSQQQSGSLSPPAGAVYTPSQTLASIANDMTPSFEGSARRKLEAAIEGYNSILTAAAQSALDSGLVVGGSSMEQFLKNVRKRKLSTGEPDRVTGTGINYKLSHLYGTMIGQIEQIASITGNPYVAELAKRLYPTPGTGLSVGTTFVEDSIAHPAFWNNRMDSILKRHLGEKVDSAKNDKNRVLLQNAHSMPGYKAAMAQYLLRSHNPVYSTLERILFELKANLGKTVPARIQAELKLMGMKGQQAFLIKEIELRMNLEENEALIDAETFNKGGRYNNITMGREADAFLYEYLEGGGIDKLFMDVGRCMSIPHDSPAYLARLTKYEPEVVAAASELGERWSREYLAWADTYGDKLADWGTGHVPRIVDGNLVAQYGNASGDDFVVTAAKAYLEDNKFQRVRLPASFKTYLADTKLPLLMAVGVSNPHPNKAYVEDMIEELDIDVDTELPAWMNYRAGKILAGKRIPESFMGFDISATDRIKGMERDQETGPPIRVDTTPGHHYAINLLVYQSRLETLTMKQFGSLSAAIKSFPELKEEFDMIKTAIDELSDSHVRKILKGPLTESEAIAIAKKWRYRIEHRASGAQGSVDGYSDLFSGDGSNLKKPDSMRQRQMDTAAADRILERFYIRDPRVFGPAYNETVTRNLMLRAHVPKAFFEKMQQSMIQDPNSNRFWPEVSYAMSKIVGSQQMHDSSSVFKSMVQLASTTTFMAVTGALQLTEPMIGGLSAPLYSSSDNAIKTLLGMTAPGTFASANTFKIAATKATNAVITGVTHIATLGQLNNRGDIVTTELDSFMYRLAERSGIIMSTFMEDLPKSSADPRSKLQRFTDKSINRYHRSGNALATVTDISRVAVLRGNVLLLETLADEILLRELAVFGKSGAGTMENFARLLKPREILILRNLGIPDENVKTFLNHALLTRSVTSGSMKLVPPHKVDALLDALIDSGYTQGNIASVLYANAINRLNTLTIQRTVPATMSRLRGLVDRHTGGSFTGSAMFFLTNFSSAFGRNIILPAAKTAVLPLTAPKKVGKPGWQETGPSTRSKGTYLTNVAYPIELSSAPAQVAAVGLMVAMSTLANYGTRQARGYTRQNPASTFQDDRTVPMKVFAAIDQAGYTGNLSLPINIVQALRYQRESAQIAAGPFFGGVAGLVDTARTLLSEKNSQNTPTAERAFAKILYDIALRPIATVGAQMLLPNNAIGDIANMAITQGVALPKVRESFMRWFAQDAGNQGQRVPLEKSVLIDAWKKNLITQQQMREGIAERERYDSQLKKDVAKREYEEALAGRKKSKE